MKMKYVITHNAVETISVVSDETCFCLHHEPANFLPPDNKQYKIIILNRREAEQLRTILNSWLKNNVDNSLDKE